MQAFHAAGWAERAEIAETFEDDRYRELARRIVFQGLPSALQPERRQILRVWLQNRLQGRDGVAARRTISDALTELDNDSSVHQPPEAEIIRPWLKSIAS